MTHGTAVELPDGFSTSDWFLKDPDLWFGLAAPLGMGWCVCHSKCGCDEDC